MLPSIFVHQVHFVQLPMVRLSMLVHANVELKDAMIPLDWFAIRRLVVVRVVGEMWVRTGTIVLQVVIVMMWLVEH